MSKQGILTTLKTLTEKAINPIKRGEEYFDSDASILPNMERSLQFDGYSCGVQSTYIILKHYGKARSVQNVDNELCAFQRGYASETAIYKLLRKRNLKVSRRLKANISTIKESIDEYEAPMLTTIDGNDHWVVIYGYSQTNIYVLDSVLLRPFVRWSKADFKARWDKWGAIIYRS